VDVVLQNSDDIILVSAPRELNERKFQEHHELLDTFELRNHIRMAQATGCMSVRRISFTMPCRSHVLIRHGHQLESRMREIRLSGSEGGGALRGSPYPYRGSSCAIKHD
jgi:hypothetical protein